MKHVWYLNNRHVDKVRARDLRKALPALLEELGRLRDMLQIIAISVEDNAPVRCSFHRGIPQINPITDEIEDLLVAPVREVEPAKEPVEAA